MAQSNDSDPMWDFWAVVFIACLVLLAVLSVAGYKPQPRVQVKREPVNMTKTGEKVGKGVGRIGIGFVKGLFKSNDGK